MVTQAVRNIEAMPFSQIIGGPLSAAIEAQAMAARTTINFIKEVGFHPPKTSEVEDDKEVRDRELNESSKIAFGDVRYVTFHYQAGGSATENNNRSISIPLLSLVPIPYLRIEEMNLEFSAALTDSGESSSSDDIEQTGNSNAKVSQPSWKSQNQFVGTYSANTKNAQKSRYNNQMNLNFQIKVVSDDLPAGMSKVLSLMEDSMHDGEIQASVSAPEWDAQKKYVEGNIVSYKEEQYSAKQNNEGKNPSAENATEWQKVIHS